VSECVCECVRDASTERRPRPPRGSRAIKMGFAILHRDLECLNCELNAKPSSIQGVRLRTGWFRKLHPVRCDVNFVPVLRGCRFVIKSVLRSKNAGASDTCEGQRVAVPASAAVGGQNTARAGSSVFAHVAASKQVASSECRAAVFPGAPHVPRAPPPPACGQPRPNPTGEATDY
jgi:hypothetical protein